MSLPDREQSVSSFIYIFNVCQQIYGFHCTDLSCLLSDPLILFNIFDVTVNGVSISGSLFISFLAGHAGS